MLKVIILSGALAVATPAAAELRPSPLGDIYESYNDCFKVTAKEGLKPAVLGSLGWTRASASTDAGAVPDDELIFYHVKRAPLILLSGDKDDGLCIVAARLESEDSFNEFKKAWQGKLPKPDAEGVITFLADEHIVQLRRTGSPQRPSMSIAVMSSTESNK